jgi:hypothetical protein
MGALWTKRILSGLINESSPLFGRADAERFV